MQPLNYPGGKVSKPSVGIIASAVTFLGIGYIIWQFLIPVEIVAVYAENECHKGYDCHGDIILVKHFPNIKKLQIKWWKDNEKIIKEKYNIPHIRDDGYYSVSIQGFGDGFRIDRGTDEDSDLLCFYEMQTETRCIEKDPLMAVGWSKNTGFFYE